MAEDIESEKRVVAFLNHLFCNKSEGEELENALLEKFVEFAKREHYEITAGDVRRSVKVRISCGPMVHKWPWPPH